MRRKKQAVILIHGIGEQRPMQTLRSFVEAVWSTDESVKSSEAIHTDAKGEESGLFSKPDRIADHFELRRLITTTNKKKVTTDFFEYYWAHRLEGTRIAHVLGWSKRLLMRSPKTLPPALKGTWYVLIGLALLILSLGVVALVNEGSLIRNTALSAALSLAVAWFITPLVLNIVGDAARYLDPAPGNIASRQAIRQAGVIMLEELHNRQAYDRIILVGHSLGSVIAFDILTHAWPRFNVIRKEDWASTPRAIALNKMEKMLQDSSPPLDKKDFRQQQRRLLAEQQRNGNAWLVTDLITLGSPLTYAEVLLARDKAELKSKQHDRELPSCPPKTETKMLKPTSDEGGVEPEHEDDLPEQAKESKEDSQIKQFISYPTVNKHKRVLHHAAVFGVTRWTNLYFPTKGIVWGDFIGGPVAPQFGEGIKDIPVQTSQRRGFLSHTLYWRSKDLSGAPEHIQTLRQALNLLDN